VYYQAWQPAPEEHGEPKAVFAVVHGYGEHSGRYLNPVNYFVPRGLAFYAYDLRGHGKSAGQRGHVNCFDGYYHEIFNEVGKETVFKDLENWLAGRV
jgi:alpha-beta hydrolase superfamily lysophospholipase